MAENYVSYSNANALATKIGNKLRSMGSAYTYKGTVTFANLPASLTASMDGNVYNISNDFTTDNRFIEGAGKKYSAGTNVAVANVGTAQSPTMMFDVIGNFIDLSPIETELANKVDKVTGKGLSTNDYDNTAKGIVDGVTSDFDAIWNAEAYTGVKNILHAVSVDKEQNNVTFELQADKTVVATVNSPWGGEYQNTYSIESDYLPAGTYKVTGCPPDGSSTTYWIAVRRDTWDGILLGRDIGDGNGFTFTLTDTRKIFVRIIVADYEGNPLTFEPMLRYAGNLDDTYETPVLTNKQLTDKAVTANPTGTSSTDLTKLQIGEDIYNIPSGGEGGTTVVPNPSGTATGDLTKVQIGNGIYDIHDTTYSVVSKTANGLAPQLPNETTTEKYLRQDGTWVKPPNTTYSDATTSASGLMSATDKSKLNGIANNANNYSLPTAASGTKGGVKVGDGLAISNEILSNPSLVYSTSEKVVGKWIDGKPIYQKTFTGNAPAVTTDNTEASVLVAIGATVKAIIDSQGVLELSGGAAHPMPVYVPGSPAKVARYCIYENNHSEKNQFRVYINTTTWNGATFKLTIRYTKTTD